MPARWLAIVFVLALLPSAELVEQGVHVVEHLVTGEEAGHDAHHEDMSGEHACTELVHVCGSHHGFGLAAYQRIAPPATFVHIARAVSTAPAGLYDLASLDPPRRPPRVAFTSLT